MRISDWSSDVCSSDLHVPGQNTDMIQRKSQGEYPGPAYRAIGGLHSGYAAGCGGITDRSTRIRAYGHGHKPGCNRYAGSTRRAARMVGSLPWIAFGGPRHNE